MNSSEAHDLVKKSIIQARFSDKVKKILENIHNLIEREARDGSMIATYHFRWLPFGGPSRVERSAIIEELENEGYKISFWPYSDSMIDIMWR